jgi:hypothetical protein
MNTDFTRFLRILEFLHDLKYKDIIPLILILLYNKSKKVGK